MKLPGCTWIVDAAGFRCWAESTYEMLTRVWYHPHASSPHRVHPTERLETYCQDHGTRLKELQIGGRITRRRSFLTPASA